MAEDDTVHKKRLLLIHPSRPFLYIRLAERLLRIRTPLSPEQISDLEQQVLVEISAIYLQHQRATEICAANQRQQQSYLSQQQQHEAEIEQARLDIEEAKTDLEAAKLIRQQNEEYEEARQRLMQHPKRSETQATNEELDREIAAIISDNNDAAHTIQWRKKQFTVLHHVVRDIQLSMTDDQEEGGDGPEAMQVL